MRPKISGAAGLSLVSIVRVALQLLLIPILARFLGPYPYGIMAIAMPLTGIACTLCDAGISSYLLRSNDQSIDDKGFTWGIIACALAGISLLIAAFVVGDRVHPDARNVILALIVMVPLTLFISVPVAQLTRKGRLGAIAAGDAAGVVLGGMIAVYGAISGWGVWSLVSQQVALLAARSLIFWNFSGYRPCIVFFNPFKEELVRASLKITASNLFQGASRTIDNFLVAALLGPRPAGAYVMMFQFVRLPETVVGGPIQMSLLHRFGVLDFDDHNAAAVLYKESTASLALVTIPAMVGLASIARPFIDVVLGPEWLPAAPILEALAGTGIVITLAASNNAFFVSHGYYFSQLILNSLATLGIVFAVIIGSEWNVVTVSWLVSAVAGLHFIGSSMLVVIILPLGFTQIARMFIKPASAASVMAGTIFFANKIIPDTIPSLIELSGLVIIGTTTYILTLFLIKPKTFRSSLRDITLLFR